jgi:hypothetical protein
MGLSAPRMRYARGFDAKAGGGGESDEVEAKTDQDWGKLVEH